MTTKEWAKEYPGIAASVFGCSIDDLDSVIEKQSVKTTSNKHKYITMEEMDRLMEIRLPDMREKVKEYISELDVEVKRCELILRNTNDLIAEIRLETLTEVKNDLQSRLEELV